MARIALVALAAFLMQDTPDERLRKKLQSPFLKKIEWIRDYDKAKAAAAKSGKLIFAYFTVTGP